MKVNEKVRSYWTSVKDRPFPDQRHLKEKPRVVESGTVKENSTVWPVGHGRGRVEEEVSADILESRRNNLTQCLSQHGFIYFKFGGSFYTLPEGTQFGVYAKDIKNRRDIDDENRG